MNIKSNILLSDSINKIHNNIVIKTDLVEPMYQISKSNNFSGKDGISSAIKVNCQSREHMQPFTTANTTTPLILSTSLPRNRPGFTTILKTTDESVSKSPVSVSLVRSNSEPNRTNWFPYDSYDCNMKSRDKGSSNLNCVINNFARQHSVPVSNASVIAFTSNKRIINNSSENVGPAGNGLTMSGLTIQRLSNSIPPVNASYRNQRTQCNREVNRNSNALEIVCANINNSSDSIDRLLGNKNHKDYDNCKGSLEEDTKINSNDYEFITNRKSIKSEGKIYCNYISTDNDEIHKHYATSVSGNAADSSRRYEKVNPVISIIPVIPSINITTNVNTVSNKGNELSLCESGISHKQDQRHKQNPKAQQLMPNSVTITQLQPISRNTAPKPHKSKLIYRTSSYEEDHITVPPVMIVDRQESYSIGVDSGHYTVEQGTRCGNPVTITPVSYSTPDTCMDDPHPLNLFSAVAANQEYLPTSTATSSTTTNDITSHTRSAHPIIMNAEIHNLSQCENHLRSGQLITTSNDEFSFSEFMDHGDTQCLSPPPAGMQRRPKVSYKNLTEGEKNVRLRMLNNEASRLYRYRKQHTIKNLEVEEKALQAVNSKLRVEFEALQLKRDEAMKMLHESLQRCRDCNPSQTVQSGRCPHRNINSSSKSAKVDTHTTKLIIKNQIRSENM